MIATVTLNPSLDRLLEVEALSADDANRVVLERHYAAGKGIDGSRVIRELGGDTVALGLVGGMDGHEIGLRLEAAGVPSDFVSIPGETRVNILLFDRSTGKQYIVNAVGPEADAACLQVVIRKLADRKPAYVIAAGSIPRGLPVDAYAEIVAGLPGANVFVDADGEALTRAVAAKPWAIKPNRHEASRLLNREIGTEAEAVRAARELERTGIRHVLLSMGWAGAVLAHGGIVWRGAAPQVKTVSAVGAGDAMVAAYTLRISQGKEPAEAFRWALAAGAAVALTPGTELCHKEDVERFFAEANVQPMP
jgi:6-phosphofructokinase 2